MLSRLKRIKFFYWLAACALLGSAGYLSTRIRTVDLYAAQKDFLRCLDELDADCMMRYATKEEIEATGLDRESLHEFLAKFVAPRVAGYAGTFGGPSKNHPTVYPPYECALFRRLFETPTGAKAAYATVFFVQGGEAKTLILRPLYDLACEAEVDASPMYASTYAPRPAFRKRYFKAITASLPELGKLKLKGNVTWVVCPSTPTPPPLRRFLAAFGMGTMPGRVRQTELTDLHFQTWGEDLKDRQKNGFSATRVEMR